MDNILMQLKVPESISFCQVGSGAVSDEKYRSRFFEVALLNLIR